MDDTLKTFKEGLLSLLNSSELTDFIIHCSPHTFKVHKVIISAHSNYFKTACQWFVEGDAGVITLKAVSKEREDALSLPEIENGEGQVSLPGDDDDGAACDHPEVIKLMIDYFYRSDYQVPGTQPAITHARGFAAAVKYQVYDLQNLAVGKFHDAIALRWKNAATFAAAAQVVCTNTAEEIKDLREIVIYEILEHDDLLDEPEIQQVVRGINGLAFELLMRKRLGSRYPSLDADIFDP